MEITRLDRHLFNFKIKPHMLFNRIARILPLINLKCLK